LHRLTTSLGLASPNWRVGASAPPGLRPGDVIAPINGAPVTNQASAATALAAAQASGSAQVQITRDGKPVTLTVPTR
jgi:general secretion pathway protein C